MTWKRKHRQSVGKNEQATSKDSMKDKNFVMFLLFIIMECKIVSLFYLVIQWWNK